MAGPMGSWLSIVQCVAAAAVLTAPEPRPVARAARGVIDGTVTDTSLAPLAEVTGSLRGTTIVFRTSAAGRFRVTQLPPGEYALVLQRVGYSSVTVPVDVRDGDTSRVNIELVPAAVV